VASRLLMGPGMVSLNPGDVLSYSAGSTQTGPEGFRKLRNRSGLLEASMRRWPELGEAIAGRTVMFINAYPAAVGVSCTGITVDTYLSPRVMTRALQLGALAGKPVIVCAQPLFLADVLLAHTAAGHPLPDTLLFLVGGYSMPRSLERMLAGLLSPRVRTWHFLQGYGVAEVDAGCMVGRERDEQGRLIYHPRDDVEPEFHGEELLLTLRGPEGELLVERWRTGDCAERVGGGYAIWNHQRLHPTIHAALEAWTDADWRRRTGYVRREGGAIAIQLRQGQAARDELELDYWDFGRRHGASWLDKPYWR
jgi:hypothetical protein